MNDKDKIYKAAVKWFRSEIAAQWGLSDKGKVEQPIPITGREDKTSFWFLAVTAEDKIVGFMQFDDKYQFLRYSSFQRKKMYFDNCPPAASWLDKETIISRARCIADDSEVLSAPFLTYYQDWSRVVWAVVAINTAGIRRTIFVAGEVTFIGEAMRSDDITG